MAGGLSFAYSEDRLRTHHALLRAAEQIGQTQFRNGRYRGTRNRPYSITPEHRAIIEASSDVLAEKISVNDAMAMLHDYDVMDQRFPKGE